MTDKLLPLGVQNFEYLIEENYVYVDKTEIIYDIITRGKPYFLSRPRRFGKSLLVSTLENLFLGKKNLFKGLWIEKSDWDWKPYPVIRFDMSQINRGTPDELEQSLIAHIAKIATRYGVTVSGDTAADFLNNLIESLSEFGHVVVLIDEYDKPIIDNISNQDTADEIRRVLRNFYAILKAQDGLLRFVFLTGVTKFTQTSIFSGLNNLTDLSMLDKTSTLLGYTHDEISHYFSAELSALADKHHLSYDEADRRLKQLYDGYLFSENGEHMYNPFSVLSALNAGKFDHFWFSTGTPSFLFELIKKRQFDVTHLESIQASADSFKSFDVENISLLAVLYQTGYLTIKNYDPSIQAYELGFPNLEVSNAFTGTLLSYFSDNNPTLNPVLFQLGKNLTSSPWNYNEFFELTQHMLAEIPYVLSFKEEKFYQMIVFLMVKFAGQSAHAEVYTQRGRIDCLLTLKDKIILFEFKLDKTAKEAMAQIKEKGYYKAYQNKGLPLYIVGMNFNAETREMDDGLAEQL